jgi:hypothetical protein
MAVAFAFAIRSCRCRGASGIVAPALFGYLIAHHAPWALAGGYFLAAGLLLGAALTEALFGIDAEDRSLEEIADRSNS